MDSGEKDYHQKDHKVTIGCSICLIKTVVNPTFWHVFTLHTTTHTHTTTATTNNNTTKTTHTTITTNTGTNTHTHTHTHTHKHTHHHHNRGYKLKNHQKQQKDQYDRSSAKILPKSTLDFTLVKENWRNVKVKLSS